MARAYRDAGLQFGRPGYAQYKVSELTRVLSDDALMASFRRGGQLPEGYGVGLDERIVEYPWVFARLQPQDRTILDAGSTLNFEWIATDQRLRDRQVVLYTLAPEGNLARPNYSYVYGDLRETILRDASVDLVVCVSTLEHVGMDNTLFYTADAAFRESAPDSCRRVMAEFHRVLRPGGRVLLTVPFGRAQSLGWLRQFDAEALEDLTEAFDGSVSETTYFRYNPTGWSRADADACASDEYVHTLDEAARPRVSYATAVACVELRK